MTDEYKEDVAIGQVLSPHGVAGITRVYPYTDYPGRCHALKHVTLELHGKRGRLTVEKASIYGRFWLIKFVGVDTREQAGRLTGGILFISKLERPSLPEGSYYFDQIEGLEVYTARGELLGKIVEVVSTGGHDLYRVNCNGKEILLPAVKQFVKQIDPFAGRMVVELPEGLTEL